MATNLIDIQKQIEELQAKAEKVRANGFEKAVKEVRALMDAYNITIADLNFGKWKKAVIGKKGAKAKAADAAKPKRTSKARGKPVAARYKGPNGETWTGRGLTPKWLKSLGAEGKSRSDFLIQP